MQKPRPYFGPGEIQQVSTVLEAKNPVLVTDKGVAEAGLLEPVLDRLGKIPVFDTIEANPKSDTINKIAAQLRRHKPDLVIGVGGGSPLDAGKALALLATNGASGPPCWARRRPSQRETPRVGFAGGSAENASPHTPPCWICWPGGSDPQILYRRVWDLLVGGSRNAYFP